MDSQMNTDQMGQIGVPAPDALNTAPNQGNAIQGDVDPDPNAPAATDDVEEQASRLAELSNVLAQVDSHVTPRYNRLVDDSDDDTDPPHTSGLAESTVQIDQAYELKTQAETLLDNPELTNADLKSLEGVIDEMESKIEEAKPLGFEPSDEPGDDMPL